MPSDSISQSLPVAGIESLRPLLLGTRHMAVAGHYGAAHAAFAVLESGGNAVDAGVAAGIALGVLQSDLVNVAGVAPIMIYRADKRDVLTISGLGTWPRAVTPDFSRSATAAGSRKAFFAPWFRPRPTPGSRRWRTTER